MTKDSQTPPKKLHWLDYHDRHLLGSPGGECDIAEIVGSFIVDLDALQKPLEESLPADQAKPKPRKPQWLEYHDRIELVYGHHGYRKDTLF